VGKGNEALVELVKALNRGMVEDEGGSGRSGRFIGLGRSVSRRSVEPAVDSHRSFYQLRLGCLVRPVCDANKSVSILSAQRAGGLCALNSALQGFVVPSFGFRKWALWH
jgi:hypothetical protein